MARTEDELNRNVGESQPLIRLAGWPQMLMIMREKKYARKCAVKVLDFVITNDPGNCDHCVRCGGDVVN
jgi:hypothetical protein|eukprot:COSAG01_NODE_1756_length_9317_cov_14.878607_5_plen_69_part_00